MHLSCALTIDLFLHQVWMDVNMLREIVNGLPFSIIMCIDFL